MTISSRRRKFTDGSTVIRHQFIAKTDSNYKIDHGANPGKQNRTRHPLPVQHKKEPDKPKPTPFPVAK